MQDGSAARTCQQRRISGTRRGAAPGSARRGPGGGPAPWRTARVPAEAAAGALVRTLKVPPRPPAGAGGAVRRVPNRPPPFGAGAGGAVRRVPNRPPPAGFFGGAGGARRLVPALTPRCTEACAILTKMLGGGRSLHRRGVQARRLSSEEVKSGEAACGCLPGQQTGRRTQQYGPLHMHCVRACAASWLYLRHTRVGPDLDARRHLARALELFGGALGALAAAAGHADGRQQRRDRARQQPAVASAYVVGAYLTSPFGGAATPSIPIPRNRTRDR
jgi:hypothetical protein